MDGQFPLHALGLLGLRVVPRSMADDDWFLPAHLGWSRRDGAGGLSSRSSVPSPPLSHLLSSSRGSGVQCGEQGLFVGGLWQCAAGSYPVWE